MLVTWVKLESRRRIIKVLLSSVFHGLGGLFSNWCSSWVLWWLIRFIFEGKMLMFSPEACGVPFPGAAEPGLPVVFVLLWVLILSPLSNFYALLPFLFHSCLCPRRRLGTLEMPRKPLVSYLNHIFRLVWVLNKWKKLNIFWGLNIDTVLFNRLCLLCMFLDWQHGKLLLGGWRKKRNKRGFFFLLWDMVTL